MYFKNLAEVILLSIRDIAGICKQVTIFIIYKDISMLVTLPRYIYASMKVSDIIVLTVHFKMINFLKTFLLFFPKFLLFHVLRCRFYLRF